MQKDIFVIFRFKIASQVKTTDPILMAAPICSGTQIMASFSASSLKFQQFYLMKFYHYEKIMRFKKSPQLPGAGRTRAWHHHGSHTPTSPGAILLGKMAYHTKQIRRQCTTIY